MSWIIRFRNLVRSGRLHQDLSEELQFHLESRAQENIASGMGRDEAEIDARRRFGNRTCILENVREADIFAPLENVIQDIRFAARLMNRRPMFTAMAIVLLALGIGLGTSMFSLLVRSVFPRSAFENAVRLVFFVRFDKKQDRFLESFAYRLSYSDLSALRDQSHSLEQMSIYRFGNLRVNLSGDPENIRGFEVEPTWLPALGISPLMGRNFSTGDRHVVLVTQAFWQQRFDGDAKILGRTMNIDETPFTIVGVLPARFNFDDAQLFVPLVPELHSQHQGKVAYYALANLRSGFSLQRAQAELNAILPAHEDWVIHLATLKERIANECGPTCSQQHNGVWLLFGAASLVMLLACANVANLLLARSSGRRNEFRVRAAIGCSRLRLIRQILTETGVLFLCGGALALFFADWFTIALARFAASYIDTSQLTGVFPLDSRALLFALSITLVTAVTFGGLPAVRSASALFDCGIRETPKVDSVPLFRSHTRGLLIASEFALSLILLVGFGLLFRSFSAVESIPVGIRTEGLLTMSANVAKKYADPLKRIAFAQRLLEKVRGLPGVSAVALTSALPLTGADDTHVRVKGIANSPLEVRYVSVSPNFFADMELPIIAGRPFGERDSSESAYVVVINQTMAQTLFPNGDALGQFIQMDESQPVWREIVGIAADVRQRNLEEDSRPVFYRPYTQGLDYELSLALRVRSQAEVAAMTRIFRNAVRDADPDVTWESVKSMQQVIYDSESLSLRRPIVRLLGVFGFLALVLTAAGLFAVLSYSVMTRTREIAIRMAIGARPFQVLRQVVGEILWFTAPGALVAAIFSYALSALLPSGHIGWSGSGIFLYGTTRSDVVTYLGVFVLLCLIGLAGAYIPARRAMQIDPSTGLREE